MTLRSLISGLPLVAAGLLAANGQAQEVLSTEIESQAVTIVPLQGSNGGMSAYATRPAAAGDASSVLQESEVTRLAFQIPDFNPKDLETRFWHYGLFSDTGNGSGTAYPDDNGYFEYEIHRMPGQNAWQSFVYSVHVETLEVQVFIDVIDLTVNKAVEILNNLAINSDNPLVPGQGRMGARLADRSRGLPPVIGNQRRLGLQGDYLSYEDMQEQIFQQTRCNVERTNGVFYLAACN